MSGSWGGHPAGTLRSDQPTVGYPRPINQDSLYGSRREPAVHRQRLTWAEREHRARTFVLYALFAFIVMCCAAAGALGWFFWHLGGH